MATVCDCNVGLSNMGAPDCQNVQNVTAKLIVVPTFDSDGIRNFIDTTATLDQAFIDARVNDDDPSQRWFIASRKKMKNVEDVKGDSVFETFTDTSNIFVREGARTFAALILKQSPTFLGKIKSVRCVDISVFLVDIDGNLIGSTTVQDKLFPIRVDKETWDAKDMRTADTTVQRVMLNFEFASIEKDEDVKMIKASEFEAGVDLLVEKGLIDVNVSITTPATPSTVGITTKFDYGTAIISDPLVGKDSPSDWVLNEITPVPGPVSISSVVEIAPGVYDITFSTQSSADVLELDLVTLGFDMPTLTITIP